jgi:hypothetical protein
MKDIYHFHITIKDITSNQLVDLSNKIKGSKPTEIDLYNDSANQLDRMLTVYSGWVLEFTFEYAREVRDTIQENGYEVDRIKIEKLIDDFSSLREEDESYYEEVHIKVVDDEKVKNAEYPFFRKSNNPNEQGVRFLNARCYDRESLGLVEEVIEQIKNELEVVSIHYESVMFDSNPNVDSWWLMLDFTKEQEPLGDEFQQILNNMEYWKEQEEPNREIIPPDLDYVYESYVPLKELFKKGD